VFLSSRDQRALIRKSKKYQCCSYPHDEATHTRVKNLFPRALLDQ
jgi:hypothetical protein